jgi:hypothetical protein
MRRNTLNFKQRNTKDKTDLDTAVSNVNFGVTSSSYRRKDESILMSGTEESRLEIPESSMARANGSRMGEHSRGVDYHNLCREFTLIVQIH